MNLEINICSDLLTVPLTPPPIIRQNASNNLFNLTSFNNNENINIELSLDTEVNINENIFRTMPNFDNLSNLGNLSNLSNLTQIKRCNSEYRQSTNSPDLKRFKTF